MQETLPTMNDLLEEELKARTEEEEEVERKRDAAEKLARARGLSMTEPMMQQELKIERTSVMSNEDADNDAPEPFPSFDAKEGGSGRSLVQEQDHG